MRPPTASPRYLLRAIAVLVALLALTLSGCGASGDGGEEDGGEERRVVVDSRDGAFDPQVVYDAVADGVVTVRSSFDEDEDERPGLLDPGTPDQGQGSGFVISGDGEIVTNAHVIADGEAGGGGTLTPADEIYVQFADRNQVAAEVVGFDPFADIALLEVDPQGLGLQPLDLGSTEEIAVGDHVAAVGSPFGQQQSLSVGVVSAADRSIQSLTRFTINGAIQTDASINPGNSGGPLLDADAEVIGINQQIRTATGASEGVGFAVPVEVAERAIEQLRDDGEVSYAFMGVTTQAVYPQLAERLGLDVDTGALIVEVTDDSPADEAGLRAGEDEIRFQGLEVTIGGDVIVAVEGQELVEDNDLPRIVELLEPGDEVTLEIIRDGEREEIDVTLGERPSDLG